MTTSDVGLVLILVPFSIIHSFAIGNIGFGTFNWTRRLMCVVVGRESRILALHLLVWGDCGCLHPSVVIGGTSAGIRTLRITRRPGREGFNEKVMIRWQCVHQPLSECGRVRDLFFVG